jgi:nicotinamidase-related amidase
MNSIVYIREFRRLSTTAPALVLVDLHRFVGDSAFESHSPAVANALVNCAIALANARALGFPVAFVRRIESRGRSGEAPRLPQWIPGFEPKRCDMVFDRQFPSCYSSPEFVDMANAMGGNCVIAGLCGESGCLATVLDGHHRQHNLIFLSDASASRSHNGVDASTMHAAITAVISLYGTVTGTQGWIRLSMRQTPECVR